MKNRIRESLSALCDGECDELELRRVLNHVDNDIELRDQWNNFHLIGATMRGEAASTVDLSRGIMQAIDGEPMDDLPAYVDAGEVNASLAVQGNYYNAEPSKKALPGWMVSGGVAASVTLAVLLGARALTDHGAGPVINPGLIAASSESAPVVTAQNAAPTMPDTQEAAGNVASTVALASSNFSAEELAAAQESLRQYVLEHEDQSFGIRSQPPAPYVRVANFGGADDGLRDSVRAEINQGVSVKSAAQDTSGK